MTELHRPHLEFAFNLHRKLPGKGNLAWSPYSVASALGLTAAGARGETRAQLEHALTPGGDLTALAAVLKRAAAPEQASAAVANGLWMREGLGFEDSYQAEVLSWPGGSVQVADFENAAERARVAINIEVEKVTHDLIKELLPPGSINPDTAAVLVNALYLKVAWLSRFAAGATRPQPFHAPSGTRDVPTMRQSERMNFAEVDGWRMVTLPTQSEIVVDVVLPDGEPDAKIIERLYGAARSEQVELYLPKLRVEASATLNGPLAELGVVDAFSRDRADFSGMTAAQVWIDAVLHKTVLEVDEEGFEGAAATAVVMRLTSVMSGKPITFRVDRPFLLIVRNIATGAIYFLTRIESPG